MEDGAWPHELERARDRRRNPDRPDADAAGCRGAPRMILGIHHPAISTPDLDRLATFYRDLFGLEEVTRFGWKREDDFVELCDI